MTLPQTRWIAAFPAALVLGLASGCVYSLLPYDRGDLVQVVTLSAVHDAVEAAAATAPATAADAYENLRRDFNAFIGEQESAVTAVGASMVTVSKVTFDSAALAGNSRIQGDLTAFAAAAPNAPTGALLSRLTGISDVLVTKMYPAADAIKDSRAEQAAAINQTLESLKLAPWASVNREPTGTR